MDCGGDKETVRSIVCTKLQMRALKTDRHYLYMLSRTPVKQEAFEDLDLLSEVAQFKDKFYHCSWARYDEATPDRMKLVPSGETTALLREDYDLMQTMIFGKHVAFDDIMEGLQHLEAELRTIPH
jgi:hypothetical protein